jgi:hypothetical protein
MAESDDRDQRGSDAGRAQATRPKPHQGPRASAAKAARQQQLAAEMRANLKKRKAQARARQNLDGDRSS